VKQSQGPPPPHTMAEAGADEEPGGEGPLWPAAARQLYRSEVSHVKRLVGERLIQQNRTMWNELASLQQIFAEFQQRNDELSDTLRRQLQLCGSKHRDLLRQQMKMTLSDVRSQADAAGYSLGEVLPELRDPQLESFIHNVQGVHMLSRKDSEAFSSQPSTPSTRPSSAGGRSGCSTPDPLTGIPPLPLGRQLGLDELDAVAESIREALHAEHVALLSAIGEQTDQLEAEMEYRTQSVDRAQRGEPSTAKVQQFVRRLQDLAVSPILRTASLTSPTVSLSGVGEVAAPLQALTAGGSNVRRLQALVAQRRQALPSQQRRVLGAVPETTNTTTLLPVSPAIVADVGAKRAFDPFFDDPFE